MRIAVVLAHNWANTGMYSVDLSAFRLFESFGQTVDYFVASGAKPHSLFKSGQVPIYAISDAASLSHYDKVVYWGDFTTSPHYGLDDLNAQLNSYDGPISRNDVFRYWRDMFLLSAAKKDGQKLYSFCQNFQTLSLTAASVDYQKLSKLYERFALIMPRDTVSTAEVAKCFPSIPAQAIRQGCDAAFLLSDALVPPPARDSRKVGIFFARSKIDNRPDILQQITARGYEPVGLNQWLQLPRNRYHENFTSLCERIAGCTAIVTDTYHLAVNAIRLGTIPVVLGANDHVQTSTVSDFKKRTMLRDLDAEDLYVPVDNGLVRPDQIGGIVDRLEASARETHPVHARASDAADAMRAAIRQAMLN